jgi:hypothetical protein
MLQTGRPYRGLAADAAATQEDGMGNRSPWGWGWLVLVTVAVAVVGAWISAESTTPLFRHAASLLGLTR